MIKVGNMVDYHSVIGGEITSKHHIVKGILPGEPRLANITGIHKWVHVAALTPSEWDELWLEDKGLCEEALKWCTSVVSDEDQR